MHKLKENIYMIVKNITEKWKTVLSLVFITYRPCNLIPCHHGKRCNLLSSPNYGFYSTWFSTQTVPIKRLDELQLWNSFSYYPTVNSWDILTAASGKYIGKDKKWYHGKYLFTVDWGHPDANILDTDHSEIPHEHKCAHIIALDNGNYAAQPNNRCIWDLPSFTVKDNIPDWKVQNNEWNVEDTGAMENRRH